MFTAESIKLLAQDARRRAKGVTERDTPNRGGGAHRNYDQNIERPVQYDPEMGNPVTAGDDPDANIDPDDVVALMSTPPPPLPSDAVRPGGALSLFGKDDDAVSPADAEACLRLVRARLEATAGRHASTGHGRRYVSRLGKAGTADKRSAVRLLRRLSISSLPTTVGELHEMIEALRTETPGRLFVELWQSACGVEEPKKEENQHSRNSDCVAPIALPP